jgi:hypothetical protein
VGDVLSPRKGYVRQAVVDQQQLAFLGVDVDQHSLRRFALAGLMDRACGSQIRYPVENMAERVEFDPIPQFKATAKLAELRKGRFAQSL